MFCFGNEFVALTDRWGCPGLMLQHDQSDSLDLTSPMNKCTRSILPCLFQVPVKVFVDAQGK